MVVGIGLLPRHRVCSQRWTPCFACSAPKILKSWRILRKPAHQLIATRKCHAYRTSVCSVRRNSTPTLLLGCFSSFSVTTIELASPRFFVRLSDVHELQTPSKSSNELNTSSRTCFSTLRASGAARASDARHKRATIEPPRAKLPKKRLGLTNHNSKKIRDRGFLSHDSRTGGGLFDELWLKALIFINEISRAAVDNFFLKKLRFLSTEFFILLGPPLIIHV